jgi:hypothetical protein
VKEPPWFAPRRGTPNVQRTFAMVRNEAIRAIRGIVIRRHRFLITLTPPNRAYLTVPSACLNLLEERL